MNFIRTLSGAVATSIVQTVWEDKTTHMHAELVNVADSSGATLQALANAGASPEVARQSLDHLVQGQSVMLATNEIMASVAIAFCIGALVIWFAPRPTRAVDMTQAGH